MSKFSIFLCKFPCVRSCRVGLSWYEVHFPTPIEDTSSYIFIIIMKIIHWIRTRPKYNRMETSFNRKTHMYISTACLVALTCLVITTMIISPILIDCFDQRSSVNGPKPWLFAPPSDPALNSSEYLCCFRVIFVGCWILESVVLQRL